ncbi:MAG: hypothetical protein ACPGO3_12460, partial [Magnetospiraceae bacterium]
AQAHLSLAEAAPANPRERLHQAALRAWIVGDSAARAAAWEAVLIQWPQDLLALRQYTGTLFWSGDKRHQAEVISGAAADWGAGVPGRRHFLSAHSFAMAEVGQYAIGEQSARAALAADGEDLWALHGLAHVMEMQGRFREGSDMLQVAAGFLNNYNLFRGHLWWHLALFLVSQSKFDEALALFDQEIYPGESTFYLDIQNGASLLARLEFQGMDVGPDRWERLAQAALRVGTQTTIWYTAMHQVMALVRSGRISVAQSVIGYLEASAQVYPQAATARGLSAAAMAFYQGQNEAALAGMLALRQTHGDLGASHAQQDIYDQMMVMAARNLGDFPRVRHLLKARLTTRYWDETSWEYFLIGTKAVAEVHDDTGIRAAFRWQ